MNIRNFISTLRKSDDSLKIPEEYKDFYFTKIQSWLGIYRGDCPWQYVSKGGLNGGTRKISRMNAAKALCAEFSCLCFSQQIEIKTGNEESRRFTERVLQENNFWTCFPIFLEDMFALGGGVIKIYLSSEKVKLDFIRADAFIPTQYDIKGVYGGIIASSIIHGGNNYIHLEEHRKNADGYEIINSLYKNVNGCLKEERLDVLYPELEKRVNVKGLSKPLFVYFKPNIANNLSDNYLGVSVFSNAEDTLKNLDIVFDSLQREFILGKKRIIVPTSAIRGEYDSDGNRRKYFDPNDEVYQAFSADDKDELKISDNSADLRVNEHLDAMEGLLDILCMQLGLSAGTLSYHSGSMKTATEVISGNNKTYRTKTAHQQLIREGLINVIENIILLGAAMGEILPDFSEPSVIFAESVTQDNTTKIDNALRLFGAGLIDKEKAISEIYGL